MNDNEHRQVWNETLDEVERVVLKQKQPTDTVTVSRCCAPST